MIWLLILRHKNLRLVDRANKRVRLKILATVIIEKQICFF